MFSMNSLATKQWNMRVDIFEQDGIPIHKPNPEKMGLHGEIQEKVIQYRRGQPRSNTLLFVSWFEWPMVGMKEVARSRESLKNLKN